MNKTYKKGRAFEYRVRDYFKELNYFLVRQAASHFPDLIAVKKGECLAIECKVAKKYLSKRERESLIKLKDYGFIPVLAYREKRKLMLDFL